MVALVDDGVVCWRRCRRLGVVEPVLAVASQAGRLAVSTTLEGRTMAISAVAAPLGRGLSMSDVAHDTGMGANGSWLRRLAATGRTQRRDREEEQPCPEARNTRSVVPTDAGRAKSRRGNLTADSRAQDLTMWHRQSLRHARGVFWHGSSLSLPCSHPGGGQRRRSLSLRHTQRAAVAACRQAVCCC